MRYKTTPTRKETEIFYSRKFLSSGAKRIEGRPKEKELW